MGEGKRGDCMSGYNLNITDKLSLYIFIPSFPNVILSVFTDINFLSVNTNVNGEEIFC